MAAPGITYNNRKRATENGAESEALAAQRERKGTLAKVFVAIVVLAASLVVGRAIFKGMPGENVQFVALLFLSILAARMKLTLPGFDSCMSMNLPFILIAVVQLDVSQAVMVGAVSTLAQSMPGPGSHMKP